MAGAIELVDGMRILFQGDSITDCGRGAEPDGLGGGYAVMTAGLVQAMHPGMKIEVINRGIGGNRVKDLEPRWQADCIDLRPDVVSIMIGINDTFWARAPQDATPVEDYEARYRRILTRTRDELGAKVVMLEPFLVHYSPDNPHVRADLDATIGAARRLAREFASAYVPLDGVFAAVTARAKPQYWSGDGVHPTAAGHGLIALEWIRAVTGRDPRT